MFTISGVLITTLAGIALAILNRRTERRRLSRGDKVETYPELLHAVDELARLPVWPTTAGNPKDLNDDLNRIAQRVRLFGPPPVLETLPNLLTTADTLTTTVITIRENSKPAHGDLIDQRDATQHREAVEALRTATEPFLAATRVDLEVDRR